MSSDAVRDFRQAMQLRADTVCLITYRTADGHVEGMTATAVASLSLDPPSIVVCINRSSRARDAIRQTRTLSVSILSATQATIAETAGRTGGNKDFGGELEQADASNDVPGLSGSLAILECRVAEDRDCFTHTVFVAEVLRAAVGAPGTPLLHHRGGYATVVARSEP